MQTVLNAPVRTDYVGGIRCRYRGGGYVVGRFLAKYPVFFTGIKDFSIALDFNQGTKMGMPQCSAQIRWEVPGTCETLLNPVTATDLMGVVTVLWRLRRGDLGKLPKQGGLIGFDLD